MSKRHENSLQTATRWAGNLVTLYIFFWAFTLVIGSVIWCIACVRAGKHPRQYRRTVKQWAMYTDPAMGLAYLCYCISGVLALFALLMLGSVIGGKAFDDWWFHDVWGEPRPLPPPPI